ncbi:MAG: prepilin peptidase, partial [Spiribacter salinus]
MPCRLPATRRLAGHLSAARTRKAVMEPGLFALLLAAALLGLLIGSFLNVVASRVPARLEFDWARASDTPPADSGVRPPGIAWPGSRCPACHHPIRIADNVPILSYLRLKGHCRDCHAA